MKDRINKSENLAELEESKAEIKKGLRAEALELRGALSENEHAHKSGKIEAAVISMPEWEEADILYTYVSMGNEPVTRGLMEAAWEARKSVCVPKIFGKEMRFIILNSFDELLPGTWGLLEPADSGIYETAPGFVAVPGVVFGEDFVRIGFGAGYYDRFFENHKSGDGWFLAALAYEFQVQKELPAEEFDVYMDAIITEDRILRRF